MNDKRGNVLNLGDTLRSGFETWRRNLNICVPFVFCAVLTVVMAVIVVSAGMLLTGVSSLTLYHPGGEIPIEFIPQLRSQFVHELHIVLTLLAIIIALGLLINAYFIAGAIGMVKEATEHGDTGISDMLSYGNRNFIQILLAELIIAAVAAPGIAFLIPLPLPAVASSTPLLLLLLLLALSYFSIISILFALTPYAVVIGGLNAIGGLRDSFKLFRAYKREVVLLWLTVIAIGAFTGLLLGYIPYIGDAMSIILSVCVIQPLAVTWWSRLYMQIAV